MILHLAPETPAWIKGAATAALYARIGGASLALVSGPAALAFRKGSPLHRAAGNVFFLSMLAMSGVGAVVTPLLPDPVSSLAGAFTFYLVVTGWMAVKRAEGRVGAIEAGGALYALGVAAAGVIIGRLGSMQPGGMFYGEPYQIGYGVAVIATLAAVADLSVVWRRGLSGAPRIARRRWRMCVALLVALGSFAGQPKARPELLLGLPYLIVPALVVLVLMVVWLVKVRLPARRRARQALAAA